MKKLTFLLLLCAIGMSAQKDLKTIASGVENIDIRDGENLRKNAWRISPDVKPDPYSTMSRKVTFITDQDSITVKLKPGQWKDFNIRYKGVDAWTRVVCEESYLSKLKSGRKYDPSDKNPIPAFSFQDKDSPELVRIRKMYNLDSIAGDGNETSRILNLMHWVHNSVRHDGSSQNPELKNAIDLISVCKRENRGVNCRMQGMILNECLLAMGIKSRYITCMPKEEHFDDCHVINMVWSTESRKWLWIDATFDAYVMDENGSLLSIPEVRSRLISGQPMILNPEANWNRELTQTKADYLESYMTKNLYRMEVPVNSQSDYETWKAGKKVAYVQLLPDDKYWMKNPVNRVRDEGKQMDFEYYKTWNEAVFWAAP